MTEELWETHAKWWQQEFTDGADAEYEDQILPLAAEILAGFTRVLDIGCGEGQVTRRLASHNSNVLGLDATWAQISVAASRVRIAFFIFSGLLDFAQAIMPPPNARNYFEQETIEEVELGVHIPFIHRPLAAYVNALADNGLRVERMLEPAPPQGFIERHDSYAAAAFIPRLVVLICRKD